VTDRSANSERGSATRAARASESSKASEKAAEREPDESESSESEPKEKPETQQPASDGGESESEPESDRSEPEPEPERTADAPGGKLSEIPKTLPEGVQPALVPAPAPPVPTPSTPPPKPSAPIHEELSKICREVLAPIVRADGGEMYLVEGTADAVHIHLGGTCAGCPGASLTRDRVLTPLIVAALPKARITVTTGVRVPDGATRIEPVESS